MAAGGHAVVDGTDDGAPRRSYDSPVRRQRAAETRQRIVVAGAELVRGFAEWDWSALTFRAVAEAAGVGERTVYRHFPTESDLRAGVMAELAEEAGVDYSAVTVDTIAEVGERVARTIGGFLAAGRSLAPTDPTFVAVDVERRDALRRAVAAARPGLSPRQRDDLAAALDVLWSPLSYERLTEGWGMAPARAAGIIATMIDAVLDPRRP